MKKYILLFIIVFVSTQLQSQIITKHNILQNKDIKLPSTLLIPENIKNPPVVLLIAGSGPTDQDGNNFFMKNNHLKFLAEALAEKGIASLRFDKRAIPGNNDIKEENLVFEDFISDAEVCLNFLKKDKVFKKIYVLGHSQGSLIGMKLAQKHHLNGFISLAGPAESIGTTIVRQVSAQDKSLGEQTSILIDSMLMGYEVKNVNPLLLSLFHPSIQPFLRSYMSYDPAEEIKTIKTHILVLQGTHDLQVEVRDAEKLHQNAKKSKLILIDGMNHILKLAPKERNANMTSYNNPDLPVSEELINTISEFIH